MMMKSTTTKPRTMDRALIMSLSSIVVGFSTLVGVITGMIAEATNWSISEALGWYIVMSTLKCLPLVLLWGLPLTLAEILNRRLGPVSRTEDELRSNPLAIPAVLLPPLMAGVWQLI